VLRCRATVARLPATGPWHSCSSSATAGQTDRRRRTLYRYIDPAPAYYATVLITQNKITNDSFRIYYILQLFYMNFFIWGMRTPLCTHALVCNTSHPWAGTSYQGVTVCGDESDDRWTSGAKLYAFVVCGQWDNVAVSSTHDSRLVTAMIYRFRDVSYSCFEVQKNDSYTWQGGWRRRGGDDGACRHCGIATVQQSQLESQYLLKFQSDNT